MRQPDAIVEVVLVTCGTLGVRCRLVMVPAGEAGAGQQLEEDPAFPRLAQILAEPHALVSDRDRSTEVSLPEVGVPADGVGVKRRAAQIHRPSKAEGFVRERRGIDRVALDPRDRGEECQRTRDDGGIARFSPDRCRIGKELSRQAIVVLYERQRPRGQQCAGTRSGDGGDRPEQRSQDAPNIADRSLSRPVHPQVAADRDAALGLDGILETEVDGGPEVGALGPDSLEAARPGAHLRRRPRGEIADPVRVPRAQRVFVAGLPEPLAAELAKRLEEPEAVGGTLPPALDHGLLDERPDELRDVRRRRGRRRRRPPGPRRARSRRRTPTGAPTAGARARSAAGSSSRSRPRASAAGATRCGRRCPARRAGRRGPDRAPSRPRALSRTAASSRASGMPSTWLQMLQDRGGVRGVDGEARLDGRRALHEQGHRVRPEQGLGRRIAVLGQRQRRHVDHDLAGDPERLAAGGEDADVGTGPQERARQGGRGLVHVLAVVEDQERPLVGEVAAEGRDRPARRVVLEPECREHGLGHELRVLDRAPARRTTRRRGTGGRSPGRPAGRAWSCRRRRRR